jgi:Domain of unknown function (DUF4112)
MQEQEQKTIPELKMMDFIANVMDNAIPIPFTQRRFGLDALMGLIPSAGDLTSLGISGLLILTILRHGVSFSVLLKMIWNIILDASVGTIPILGDFFDFSFKANRRNVALLKAHYAEGGSRMNAWLAAAILFTIVIAVAFVLIFFAAKIVGMVWSYIWQMM